MHLAERASWHIRCTQLVISDVRLVVVFAGRWLAANVDGGGATRSSGM